MEQNNSKTKKYLLVLLLVIVLISLGLLANAYKTQIKKFLGFATITDAFLLRAVDQEWTTTGHAWGENIGWISFQEANGGIYVGDYELTGYAWGENIGWISLNCEQADSDTCSTIQYAVLNDGAGNLSGYAWGENIGWIEFAPTNGGVTIGSDGVFSGFVWGENVGWINFEATGNVSTNWRYQSARPQCNNGLDDDADGNIDYPADTSCEGLSDILEEYTGKNRVVYEESKKAREEEQSTTTRIGLATSTATSSVTTPTAPDSNQPVLTPINTISLPVTVPSKLVIKDIPTFGGEGKTSFSFSPQISSFLFAPLPDSILNTLNKSPKIKELLDSSGISKAQEFASLARNPLVITQSQEPIPGLFTVLEGSVVRRTYLVSNSDFDIAQFVSIASSDAGLTVSLVPVLQGQTTGELNGEQINFVEEDAHISAKFVLKDSSKYILTTLASSIPLIIEVLPDSQILKDDMSTELSPWIYWISRILEWFKI